MWGIQTEFTLRSTGFDYGMKSRDYEGIDTG